MEGWKMGGEGWKIGRWEDGREEWKMFGLGS